jgi:hypothetical protein
LWLQLKHSFTKSVVLFFCWFWFAYHFDLLHYKKVCVRLCGWNVFFLNISYSASWYSWIRMTRKI